MGMFGSLAGGGAGAFFGGPAGAMVGAGLGNYVEDNLLGGGAPKPGAAPKAKAVQYGGTGHKYGEDRNNTEARTAPGMDWTNADKERQNAASARLGQQELADRLRARANGELGSLAEMQLRAGQEAAFRQQLNAAANTRGGGGAALAARADAAAAGATAAQAVNAESAMLRFREQAEAEQQLGALLGNMRGQDYAGVGLGQQKTGMSADNEARNRAMNDARYMGLMQAQIEEEKAKAGVSSQGAALDYQGQLAAWNAQNQAAKDKYAASQQMTGALLGAGGSMYAGQMAGAKGGGSPAPAPSPGPSSGGGGGGYTYTDSYGQHYVPPGY